jgi:circadian clock protein KaiB
VADELDGGTNQAPKRVHLRLFVSGMTPRSFRAIESIKTICQQYFKDEYQLDVIDIYQQPALAHEEQIMAVPTLIRKAPLPVRRLIGDMTRVDRVLEGLDIQARPHAP